MNNTATVEVREVENGQMQIVVTGRLPQPSTAENAKWPWSDWQTKYQDGLLKKDGERILQSLANLRHVQSVVSARTEKREAAKAEKTAAKLVAAAAAAAATPAPVEVEAPMAAAPEAAKKQKRGKKS